MAGASGSTVHVDLGPPVVVALSAAGESRWGYHQFPSLTRLPDGAMLLMFADAADASETHGQAGPAFVSTDEGQTWTAYEGPLHVARPHFTISRLPSGDCLSMPSAPYFDAEEHGVTMPEPVSSSDVYGKLAHYRIEDFPEMVQRYFCEIPARRWRCETGEWTDEVVHYDADGLLVWRRESSRLLPRTFFERMLLRLDDELLFADYRARYLTPDGRPPIKGGTSLMVSRDDGRSFRRRSTIAVDPTGEDLLGEATLSPTADGRLVCVIRRTDHVQKPMAITWSDDRGHTWTPIRTLFDFGVWPCLLLLDNGALVLSYGRPGVHLAFSTRGDGETWDVGHTIIPGSHEHVTGDTCGYTSLLPIGPDAFLIAYSDFNHRTDQGVKHKAVVVRRVRVTTPGGSRHG